MFVSSSVLPHGKKHGEGRLTVSQEFARIEYEEERGAQSWEFWAPVIQCLASACKGGCGERIGGDEGQWKEDGIDGL